MIDLSIRQVLAKPDIAERMDKFAVELSETSGAYQATSFSRF